MQIDAEKIEAELQKVAGEMKVKVRTNRSQKAACSSRETDNGFSISLNPSRIRSPQRLREYLNDLRRDITWGQQ